jgi:hypothetical protein
MSTEASLLSEIRDALVAIKSELEFHSKLFSESMMKTQESARARKDMISVPLMLMKRSFSEIISQMPDGEDKEKLKNTLDSFQSIGV